MRWIKQIFGIKPDEDWPEGPGVLDVLAEKHELFKNATPTNTLVISKSNDVPNDICLLYTSDAADE